MKAPQFFIDTFKDNRRGQPQNKYYMISGRGSGCFYVWDRQISDVLRHEDGNPIVSEIELEAITAAWNHFIQQPEVRGLIEDKERFGINMYKHGFEDREHKPLKP